eukprot:CAMPEP_0201728296 /NCGR_PEP_ID=MMETSP0593-20130828/15438_1 /ASSEMBLY_ACC=CAM_ASM_000672 /TAXON_ID=267983 /ORGANISM="Skeletonema japonicum, Strain CCMP2506" /LENGTH=153 /DNA_ID=CAMNT_0048220351 /DNA_START=38 /DNA_END=499 /DNA_ORIENTATION=-
MKIQAALLFTTLTTTTTAFAPIIGTTNPSTTTTKLHAEIGETGITFTNVAREWRCKYTPGPSGGPADSPSLQKCQSLLSEYLPKLKELPNAQITRQVCGGCLDFKVSIVQPLEEHGKWAEVEYEPLESEFLGRLKAVEGVSQVETQEITFEAL